MTATEKLGRALQDIDGIAILFPAKDEQGGFVLQVDRDGALYESQRGQTVEEAIVNALSAMGRL